MKETDKGMKILFTGFDPFGGETINPAYEAVKRLPDAIGGTEIIKMEIPTVFGKDGRILEEAIGEYEPDAVICVGQAGGRAAITIERVAINLQDARIQDNEGQQPCDQPVYADGPAAYFTNLPVKEMVSQMKEQGIPAQISYTAGTFVCNDIMYRLMHLIHTKYPQMLGGFIHVPFLPQQVTDRTDNAPSMSVEMIAEGLRCAAEVIIKNK